MPDIYIDADGCPMKQETYRVAKRYGLKVVLVANSRMRFPGGDSIELVLVDDGLDAADDWIAEHVTDTDIVITGDIPLAARCIKKGAGVLGIRGHPFTEDSIGEALASRELLSHLREIGAVTGGPPVLCKKDRSRFLESLDNMIQNRLREK
ncbi:MAG: YaiI/YqxD family protein [Candidatus Eisenbacteria bacterium]|nr:YaiI/YqxD family protein [Candidatus Eisenbacteria bacterium]